MKVQTLQLLTIKQLLLDIHEYLNQWNKHQLYDTVHFDSPKIISLIP